MMLSKLSHKNNPWDTVWCILLVKAYRCMDYAYLVELCIYEKDISLVKQYGVFCRQCPEWGGGARSKKLNE